jgi:hypothetical protein
MKRETIEQASREISLILTPPCDRWESAHQRVANVIERLLDAEREKVREMCAAVAKDFCDESEPGNAISVKYLEDKYGTLDAQQAIRQLDLTALGDKGEK